jgi:hypothetical protein
MSHDRIWLCSSLKPKDWVKVPLKSGGLIPFDDTPKEVVDEEFQKYGSFKVLLSAGENFLFDEEFCFLREDDARRFFAGAPLEPGEQGYRDQERFREGAVAGTFDIGFGFDRVELYIHGKLIESHKGSQLRGSGG